MAVTSMMQRLLDNALTAKFAKSLKHSDLPEDWADNPEIVQLAEDAYSVMGTESPWFKAWFGNSKVVDESGNPLKVYHGTPAKNVENWAFDPDRVGSHGLSEGTGFYTATNPSVASHYAPNGGAVLEMFSNMQKPIELDQTKGLTLAQTKKIIKESATNEAKQMAKDDGVKYSPEMLRDSWISNYTYTYDKPISSSIEDVARGILQNNDTVLESIEDMGHGASDWQNIMRATQKHAGYDGVHSYGYKGTSGATADMAGDIFVHWFPESLKHVANRGTFNPDDPNIYKALPLAAGVTGGLLAMDAGEAEAAKPKHVDKLVEKLYLDDFDGMDFGKVSGKALKNWRKVEPETPEGPLKVSGKNVKKFLNKRIYQDHLEPEEFSDGVNALFHGSRTRVFPGREEGLLDLYLPKGEYAWRGVAAPKDDFSALVTAYKYPIEEMKKELNAPSGGRPIPPYPNTQKEGELPGRFTTVEGEQKLFTDPTIPDSLKTSKVIIPLAAGGLLGFPDEAQAEQARYAQLEKEQALKSPLADPVDLLLAPFGVPGLLSKAASVISEPFVSYGMDKAIGGLLDWWED